MKTLNYIFNVLMQCTLCTEEQAKETCTSLVVVSYPKRHYYCVQRPTIYMYTVS